MKSEVKPIAVRTPEAAEMLNVSQIWMKKDRAKENPIGPRCVKRGKIVLYPVKELKRWVAEGRQENEDKDDESDLQEDEE